MTTKTKKSRKEPFGRPTKYNEAMQKKADLYANGEWKKQEYDTIPTIEGLASYLGVACSTVKLWAKKHPNFSASANKIAELQKRVLLSGGLSKEFDSGVTRLLLSANHDIIPQTKQDFTSGGEKMEFAVNIKVAE